MLEEAKRLLAPGGRVLVYVPYEMHRKFRKYLPGDFDQHLYSWTPRTLGNLVALTGLSISSVKIIPYGYERAASVWAVEAGTSESGIPPTPLAGLAHQAGIRNIFDRHQIDLIS